MPLYVEAFCNISVYSVGKKSMYTHTIFTQNQFKLIEHSSHHFHSVFPSKIYMVMIIRASVAMARDHMKKALKVRPYCPPFMNELSDADMDLRCDSCPTSLKGSFQLSTYHLSQCEQQMCGVLVKGESPFLAGAGTCCTGYDIKII